MSIDAETLRVGRDRISRVFRYLRALNQHRNPAKRQIREQLWSIWFRDFPNHSSIQRGVFDQSSSNPSEISGNAIPDAQRPATDFVLKVRRPTLTQPPNPPDLILSWLDLGWENPFREAHIIDSRNDLDAREETRIVRFDEDQKRVQAFSSWRDRRDEWARNERPARDAMRTFEELYDVYGRIEREAERVELVLGDGILSWYRPEGGVHHPILLQRLQLDFNPTIPEFTLLEADHEVELYSALFQSMDDVDGKAIAQCRDELEQGGYHPLADDGTSGFLRRFVAQLSARGEFVSEGAPQGETDNPRIGRDPVIFLRARTLGYAVAIEAILGDLEEQKPLSSSLLNVVGVESAPQDVDDDSHSIEPWTDPEDVLFSKAANPEQIRIAKQLERHDGVLVQGPPGTGKSHTIANLIGHLLAQGKSVLVTSHATKALRVLRGHVEERLQPLCVSVLESDIESRSQLESSVTSIVGRLSTSDARKLDADAKSLEIQRSDLIEKLRKARQNLVDARWNEYRDVVVAGQNFSPSEAARKVSQEKEDSDWIPAPVSLGAPVPLSDGELINLYRTNFVLNSEDEVEITQALPDPKELPIPDDFDRLVDERQKLSTLDLQFRSDLWDSPAGEEGLKDLEELADHFHHAVEPIGSNIDWKLVSIAAGRRRLNRETWETLLTMINTVLDAADTAQETILRYDPSLAKDIPLEEQRETVEEIINHLKLSGKLGSLTLFTRPSWKRFIKETGAPTRKPQLTGHFQALLSLIRLQISRHALAGRWDRQVAEFGAPNSDKFGEEVEKGCSQFSEEISRCLKWYDDVFKPLENKLRALGFHWGTFLQEQPPNLEPYGDLLRLRDAVNGPLLLVLSARVNMIKWNRLEAKIDALARKVALASGERSPSRVANKLGGAIRNLDSDSYRVAFQRLVDLHKLIVTYENRYKLLGRLESVAPAWAASIRDRLGIHGGRDLPGDVRPAWLWRQLNDELELRGSVSLEQLQQTNLRLSEELREVTAELIDRRAWAEQVKRTTLSQRQALMGWLDTVRKIGKGHGKRVPRLRVEAARKMSECRTAVPVWIMPLARVVDNFDPRAAQFDVVIIDEASQSDVMALIAFYLGKKIVIVGDHEQVSPAAVGQRLSIVQHMIDEHLQGIPNAILYDGQMSVYDLARQSFGGAICLLEHFRCVPDIIQFSNQLSYNGQIKPLRDRSLVSLKPHVIPYRVEAYRESGQINSEEVWAVASLLAAALEQPEYKDKTFGAISLVGEDQAHEIERLLVRYVEPEEHKRRRILCGNAAHFQGDERDVMFLSVVDTPSDGGPLSLRTESRFKQRFNVAASRARDQMWVVHSLNPRSDLKPDDLRCGLITHAEDPSVLLRTMEEGEQRTESELEKAVLQRLVRAGYRVTPQWRVGYYRIDLVVEGGGKRLAIECDGDRYHTIEKLPEDMARQAVLERLGWTFSRIRGSHFFRDPDDALKPIFNRLEALEIPPEGHEPSSAMDPDSLGSELKERVIRRADELRRMWQEARSAGEEKGTKSTGEEKGAGSGQEKPVQQPEIKKPDPKPTPKLISMGKDEFYCPSCKKQTSSNHQC